MPVLQVRGAGWEEDVGFIGRGTKHGFTWMNFVHQILNDGIASFLMVFTVTFSAWKKFIPYGCSKNFELVNDN